MKPDSALSEWSRLEEAPPNFLYSEVRQLFHDPESNHSGSPEAFDASSVHWYQNAAGESLACVVFDGSNHVGAAFVFAADPKQTDPVDHRLMGVPFGSDPFFWEGCPEDE